MSMALQDTVGGPSAAVGEEGGCRGWGGGVCGWGRSVMALLKRDQVLLVEYLKPHLVVGGPLILRSCAQLGLLYFMLRYVILFHVFYFILSYYIFYSILFYLIIFYLLVQGVTATLPHLF
jgi:hypothetical protein